MTRYGVRGAYRPQRSFGDLGAGIALVAVVVLALFLGTCASFVKEDSVQFKVDNKEAVQKDNGNQYRVYAADSDAVYVVSDSILKLRFNSANVYNEIKEGRRYDCKKFGWRVPLFSMFENLKDCHEVDTDNRKPEAKPR